MRTSTKRSSICSTLADERETAENYQGGQGQCPPRNRRTQFASSLDLASWIKSRLLPFERGEPARFGHEISSGYEKYIRIWHPSRGSVDQRVLGSLEDRALEPLVSIVEVASNLESEECSLAFLGGMGKSK